MLERLTVVGGRLMLCLLAGLVGAPAAGAASGAARAAAAPVLPEDGAVTFDTGSYVDLRYDINNLKSFSAFTITFRAMFQYPNSHYNNVIGQSGNPYFVITKTTANANLAFVVSGTNGVHVASVGPAAVLPKEQWVDVAVRVAASQPKARR